MNSSEQLFKDVLINSIQRFSLKEDFKAYFVKDEGTAVIK